MSADRVCDKISYKQGAELLSVLIKAGLTAEKAQMIIVAPGNNLARTAMAAVFGGEVMPVSTAPNSKSGLLEFVSTVPIPARTERFVAGDKFVINCDDDAPVKIEKYCFNFWNRFLSLNGKTEKPFAGSILRAQRLVKPSPSTVIISEIGGKIPAETQLSEVYAALEMQGHGQAGNLQTDGWWNLFFVRDISGELCCLAAEWGTTGWCLMAGTAKGLSKWGADVRVFSRMASGESKTSQHIDAPGR